MSGLANSALRSLLDDLVTTAFPSDCRICNTPLLRSTLLPVCDSCRAKIPPQSSMLCQRCGEALDMDTSRFTPAEGLLCYPCRAVPPAFERAVAFTVYQREVREMVHLLKYERMKGLTKLLGSKLADAILTLRQQAGSDLTVVAVPLFPSKQRERGYNQAELLADAAVADLRKRAPEWKLCRAPGILKRKRDTRSQFELNPTGRRRNLKGAFEIDASRIVPGCEILLIDDIYTTGATARECAQVLRRAGAGRVWVATLARAQTPRAELWDASPGFG